MGSENIRDSIRYLHSNPKTTYSQLIVAACKAESKMEEAREKVRARSAAATEAVDSSKDLGNQIMRLMAALTRAEQGNHPASAPNSPRHRSHGRGQMDRNTSTHPSSHNGQTGLCYVGQYVDKSFKISLSSFSCLGVILLHFILCTVIHNCSSSGSLFFTSLRWNN